MSDRMIPEEYTREALLIGEECVAKLMDSTAAVFGLGGVGGMTAEALCRSGVGRLMLEAINLRDYPIIQGGVLFISISYCVINLAVDLLYGVVDPRIRVR